MKNAQTRNAFIVAITIANGNENALGIPIGTANAEVTTVKLVKKISEKKTPNNSLVDTG